MSAPDLPRPRTIIVATGLAMIPAILFGASPAGAEELTLKATDVPSANIAEANPEQLAVADDALELTLDPNEIALGMLAWQDEAAAPPKWKSSFTLGASGSFGNTDNQNLNLGLASKLDQGDQVTKVNLNYYLALTDGDRTDDRFNANFRHDWLLPDSPWLYFIQSRYDYDRFQTWLHRLSGHAGFGYRLVDNDIHTLSIRAGAGVSKEWKSPEQEFRPEVLGGVDWDWTVSEKQTFHLDSTIFPDLDNTGEFRTITNAEWSVLLDEETAMSLTAGVFHEYQSDAAPDVDKNDIKVYIGLKFEF